MNDSGIAFVIGGSSGIGLETAKQLVARGISTTILGNNANKLEAAQIALQLEARKGVKRGGDTGKPL